MRQSSLDDLAGTGPRRWIDSDKAQASFPTKRRAICPTKRRQITGHQATWQSQGVLSCVFRPQYGKD
jgi:hypothetical protein